MPKNTKERTNRLMPDNVPKYIRCYDNQGESADRYTVVFTGRYEGEKMYLAMSAAPFHPQGIGMHGFSDGWSHIDTNKWGWAPAIGKSNHLGKRINFSDLPEDCRKLVIQEYKELWNIDQKNFTVPMTCQECGKKGQVETRNPAMVHKTITCSKCKKEEKCRK